MTAFFYFFLAYTFHKDYICQTLKIITYNMKKNLILLLALTLMISFGCKKKYDIYTDSDIIYVAGSNGSTGTVKITANTSWVISSTAFKWLKISPKEGVADETVTFTCNENMSVANREAIVTIADINGNTVKQIKLIQYPFSYGSVKMVVAANDGIYYSYDGGYTLIKQALNGQYVGSLVKTGDGFFATSVDGVYFSPDGYGWDKIKSDSTVNCITAENDILYIGTTNNIQKSSDGGINWTTVNGSSDTRSIAVMNGNILAGATTGVNYLPNGSSTWVSGLTNRNICNVALSNNALYAGTTWSIANGASGIWKSTDGGASWTVNFPLSDNIFSMVVTKKDTIYSGSGVTLPTSANRGFYKSYDGGATWSTMNLNNYNINAIARYKGYLYAGTSSNGLFVSIDDGNNWSKMNNTGIIVNAIIASKL